MELTELIDRELVGRVKSVCFARGPLAKAAALPAPA